MVSSETVRRKERSRRDSPARASQWPEQRIGLSGGQKQRLAIARAILKRPKILIFDEATSALDQKTAERFAQTVNKLKAAATILFVAHQMPIGLAVDQVFSLPTRPGCEGVLDV